MERACRLPHRTVHSDVSKKMWTAKADNGSGRYVTNEKFGSGHRERALERRRLRRRGGARRTVLSTAMCQKRCGQLSTTKKQVFKNTNYTTNRTCCYWLKICCYCQENLLLLLSRERKKFTTNQKALIRGGAFVGSNGCVGAMRKPLIFVARVHGGSSCTPAVALGFESASDGDTVCVTCPTTYQRWKLPKTSVQAHVGIMAKGVRQRAKRYLERISKPSEIIADRVCIVCIVCRAGQIGLGCGHLPTPF